MKARSYAALWLIAIILHTIVVAAGAVVKQNGMNFLNGQWSGPKYDSNDAMVSLSTMKTGNVSYLALSFAWFQETVDTPGPIWAKVGTSPTDAQLSVVVKSAHAMGMKIMVRPLVDPNWANPLTNNTWRGMIGRNFTAADWDKWFLSYQAFIYHFAEFATQHQADEFCVGGELIIASMQSDHWRTLVAGVRERFKGPILYAANHGQEGHITWWDAVDFIGVDAYYTLVTEKPDPTVAEIIAAWAPIKESLHLLSLRYNKPVLFGEIGFCSRAGSTNDPAHCGPSDRLDLQAQANAYEATFQSFYHEDWFHGIFWWAFLTNTADGGPTDQYFSPKGKPAWDVMKRWYSR